MLHAPCSRGFTLIEMIVAVGIFAIIMTISVGSFISLMQANYRAQTVKVTVNNLHFALENMARNLRTGSAYHCDVSQGNKTAPRDCPNTSADSIMFKSRDGGDIVYAKKEARIVRSDGDDSFTPLTAPDISVEKLQFFVDGAANKADNSQPRVFILMSGFMKGKGTVGTSFALQTLVTQRMLDVEIKEKKP